MRRVLAITVVLLAVTVAPADGAGQSVAIDEFRYVKDRVRIDPGESVTWTARGEAAHTVSSRRGVPQGFDSGNVDPGQTFTRAFTRAGTYAYVCRLHPGLMSGVVQVGPDRVRPKVTGLAAAAARTLRLTFRVSEEAKVVVRLARGGRTARTIRVRGPVEGSVARKFKRPPSGRYRVVVRATDLEGNRARPVSAALTVR